MKEVEFILFVVSINYVEGIVFKESDYGCSSEGNVGLVLVVYYIEKEIEVLES